MICMSIVSITDTSFSKTIQRVFRHNEALLVYTVSRLVEQSTPAVAKLSDTYAVATNLPRGCLYCWGFLLLLCFVLLCCLLLSLCLVVLLVLCFLLYVASSSTSSSSSSLLFFVLSCCFSSLFLVVVFLRCSWLFFFVVLGP